MQIHARTGSDLRCDNQACAKAEAYVCISIHSHARTHLHDYVYGCVYLVKDQFTAASAQFLWPSVCMFMHVCVCSTHYTLSHKQT